MKSAKYCLGYAFSLALGVTLGLCIVYSLLTHKEATGISLTSYELVDTINYDSIDNISWNTTGEKLTISDGRVTIYNVSTHHPRDLNSTSTMGNPIITAWDQEKIYLASEALGVWNATTSEQLSLLANVGWYRSFTNMYVANGALIAASTGHMAPEIGIFVWNTETLELQKTFYMSDIVDIQTQGLIGFKSIAQGKDNLIAVSIYGLNDIFLWDIESEVRLGTLKGHHDTPAYLTFDNDKNYLAGVEGNKIHIWEIATQTLLTTLTLKGKIIDIDWQGLPDVLAIATPSHIYVWDSTTDQLDLVAKTQVRDLAWRPLHHQLTIVTGESIYLVNIQ